jgi:hypothetical protein
MEACGALPRKRGSTRKVSRVRIVLIVPIPLPIAASRRLLLRRGSTQKVYRAQISPKCFFSDDPDDARLSRLQYSDVNSTHSFVPVLSGATRLVPNANTFCHRQFSLLMSNHSVPKPEIPTGSDTSNCLSINDPWNRQNLISLSPNSHCSRRSSIVLLRSLLGSQPPNKCKEIHYAFRSSKRTGISFVSAYLPFM